MSDFWKKANSTEFSFEQRVCYDTTSFDSSIVFEYEESYAEYRFERQFETDGTERRISKYQELDTTMIIIKSQG